MAQSHEDEWEAHREELKHLWLDRKWTTKQVQEYMSQSYGFYRSESQFARQFNKWEYKKKVTREDWQFVSSRREKRKRDGKDPGWVWMRGKRIPDHKVRKEISRHVPLSSKYSGIETSDPKTPEGIFVCTPGAQPPDIDTEPDSQANLLLNDWSHPPSLDFSNWVIPEALQLSSVASPPPIILSDPSSLDFILQRNIEPTTDPFNHTGNILEWDMPVPVPSVTSESADWGVQPQNCIANTENESMAEGTRMILSQQFKSFDGSDGPSFFSKLEPITAENFNLGCAGKATASVQSPLRDKLFDYLSYCIYLSSNNHLSDYSTAKLVSLIAKYRAFPLLRTILKSNDTAVEIFMGNLLRSAAGLGEVEICDILIQAGADLDCLTGDTVPTTALHRALENAQNECVKLLLAAGADPNLTVDKRSPLQVACSDRYPNPLERVRLLCSFGAAVNPPFKSSRLSPLQLAIRAEDTELARYLLKEGADPDFFANPKSGTPLQLASAFSGNSGMAELLLEEGANINSRSGYQRGNPHAVGTEDSEMDSDSDSESDLDFYYSGNDEGAIYLAERLSFSFMPPILIAAIRENWEVVQFLLDEGAKVNPSWRTCNTELLEDEMSSYTTPVFTPLQAAVLAKNITMTRMILTHGAHIDARPKGNQGHTALQIAVMVMSERLVELLLAKGADVNAPAGILYGKTALQAAAEHSDTKILRILLENGAHVNALPSERNGKTALQFAIAAGNIEGVEILLDSQAAVNTNPYVTGGVTALKEAARLQDPAVKKEILHLLMRAGVDTKVLTNQSRNAPLHSFVECGDLETTRKLLEKGVSPNPGYSAESCLTPLQEASALGQESLVELLIKHGADINAPAGPYKGRTALQAAAEKNRQSVVDLLLKSGADIKSEASSYRGLSAIEAAVVSSNEKLVRVLLTKCPDAILSDQKARHRVLALALERTMVDVSLLKLLLKAGACAGNNEVSAKETSIMQAAIYCSFDVFRCILAACANPNQRWIRDSPGDVTAIQAAASRNNIDVVRALLEKGADANAPANKLGGMTALQTAVSQNNFEMVVLLIQHGADVNGLPSPIRGRTALQAAAEGRLVKLSEYLIACGASVNAPAAHNRGVSALQGAAIKGNIRIVEILLRCGAEINGAPAIEQGRSAIEGAAENGRLHTLQLLLDKHPNTEEFDIRRKRASRFAQGNGQVAIERFLLAYRKQPRV